MKETKNPQENNEEQRKVPHEESDVSADREKQQRSDPNITELNGLIDPDEDLEPKDTDNKTSL